jgi:hypothetical protein
MSRKWINRFERWQEIKGNFNCFFERIDNTNGGPTKVNGSYYANNKWFFSGGSPNTVGGSFFYVTANYITNLVGCPKRLVLFFSFDNSYLTFIWATRVAGRKIVILQESMPKAEKFLPQIIMDNQKKLPIVFRYMHAIWTFSERQFDVRNIFTYYDFRYRRWLW